MSVTWTAPDDATGWLSVAVGPWSVVGGVRGERAAIGAWSDGERAVAVIAEAWPDGPTGRRVAKALVGDWIGLLATRRWAPLPTAVDVHDALQAAHSTALERGLDADAAPVSLADRALQWLRGPDVGAVRFAALMLRVDAQSAGAARGFGVSLGDVPLWAVEPHATTSLIAPELRARLASGAFTVPRGATGEPYVGSPLSLTGGFAAATTDTPDAWTASLARPDRDQWIGTQRGAFVAAVPLFVAPLGAEAAPGPIRAGPAIVPAEPTAEVTPAPRPRRRDPSPPPPPAPLFAETRAPRRPVYVEDPAAALERDRAPRGRRGNLTRWVDPNAAADRDSDEDGR